MQTIKRFITGNRWKSILVLALTSTMLLGASACGKKGPLYLEPTQENSEKK